MNSWGDILLLYLCFLGQTTEINLFSWLVHLFCGQPLPSCLCSLTSFRLPEVIWSAPARPRHFRRFLQLRPHCPDLSAGSLCCLQRNNKRISQKTSTFPLLVLPLSPSPQKLVHVSSQGACNANCCLSLAGCLIHGCLVIIGFKDERVVSRLRCSCRASGVCESISISSVYAELRWDSGEITTQVDLPPIHTQLAGRR